MPKTESINKVLVIGSGPIVIGQAAEFDYSGTQALKTLREQGIETVLINSNPATIMTDKNLSDRVYIEPLSIDFLKRIIIQEKPDAILATLGGQTALNLALEIAKDGFLDKQNVVLLGVNLETIEKAEDREQFKQLMLQLNEPVPQSTTIKDLEDAVRFEKDVGLPLIIRPAFTLGGSGGGIAHTQEEFREYVKSGLACSPINQCLIEKSIAGFKEIEYEIVRDKADNCVVICNMENFDPVGVHTGDSIVIAPSQTLSDNDHQMLRDVSIKLIRELKIEGACNVQLALDPYSSNYYIIEVNPRVSRSSALASKATGYPIAQVATKIALGYTMDEIINPITKNTYACFEPTLDYVVTKFPRWPFDKFHKADRRLGTQMKATGEVMAFGRSFEESLLKAIRGLEIKRNHIFSSEVEAVSTEDLLSNISQPTDERIFEVAQLIRRNISIKKINEITKIDCWFLYKLANIVRHESLSKADLFNLELIKNLKRLGFSDNYLSSRFEMDEISFRNYRINNAIIPTFKTVDTCAAEFEAYTPYYYSTYEFENEAKKEESPSILVLGSGPIRIGQGLEFDYATVHAIEAIKESSMKAIIINNNPATVSTDFHTSDKLYFESVSFEDVMNVIDIESPKGVICQFGGQTAINMIEQLSSAGINILGSSADATDLAENRNRFESELKKLEIAQPVGTIVTNTQEAIDNAKELKYPLMLRPSYVIGGQAMQIVYNDTELKEYIGFAMKIWPDSSVLMDRYMIGTELEVDAICDGVNVFIPGIMEHIEKSGIHSGDSFAVYPPQSLCEKLKNHIINTTTQICLSFGLKGLINIQFIIKKDKLYVLEVNPRSSRTVPFMSKVTNIQIAKVATKVLLGSSLKDQGLKSGIHPDEALISIKAPVFSFSKLKDVDSALGPEMKSTGEAMGRDTTMAKALIKAFKAIGIIVPDHGTVLLTIADKHKKEVLPMIRRFKRCGFQFIATPGTALFLAEHNIHCQQTDKISHNNSDILEHIRSGEVQLVINTITKGKHVKSDGAKIRKAAVESSVVCMTSLDTTMALLETIEVNSPYTEAL